MPGDRFPDKFLDVARSLRVLAALNAPADDVLEFGTGPDEFCAKLVHVPELLVAGDKPIIAIPHDEAVRHALDGIFQNGARPAALNFHTFTLTNRGVERQGEDEHKDDGDCDQDDHTVPVAYPVRHRRFQIECQRYHDVTVQTRPGDAYRWLLDQTRRHHERDAVRLDLADGGGLLLPDRHFVIRLTNDKLSAVSL